MGRPPISVASSPSGSTARERTASAFSGHSDVLGRNVKNVGIQPAAAGGHEDVQERRRSAGGREGGRGRGVKEGERGGEGGRGGTTRHSAAPRG